MPNHFLTVGLCGRDYARLEKQGLEDWSEDHFKTLEGANLCSLVERLPDELTTIVASKPRCRYRNKSSGEWLKDVNGPSKDFEQWERVELTNAEVESLVAKYGAADWYDWQLARWGTKWGTYDTKVHELGGDGSPVLIEFQSAWSPPSPEMMRRIDDYICETYCLKNIRWIGHDPYDDTPVDIEVA